MRRPLTPIATPALLHLQLWVRERGMRQRPSDLLGLDHPCCALSDSGWTLSRGLGSIYQVSIHGAYGLRGGAWHDVACRGIS